MGKLACVLLLLAACGDDRSAAPPPDPSARVAPAPDPTAHRAPDSAPPAPPPREDPADVCRALAKPLAEMHTIVAEAQRIPRDQALYTLAARLAQTERTIEIAQHELGIVDRETGAPEFALQPDRYRTLRKLEQARLERLIDEDLATAAALRDEAARSRFPALAGEGGPAVVLDSIRWRDAAAHVDRYRAGCAQDPHRVDAAALRDFVSGMALVDHDAHGVGTRALERRLLAGDNVARGLP